LQTWKASENGLGPRKPWKSPAKWDVIVPQVYREKCVAWSSRYGTV